MRGSSHMLSQAVSNVSSAAQHLRSVYEVVGALQRLCDLVGEPCRQDRLRTGSAKTH